MSIQSHPKRLSVLWLSPFFPYPPEHGGAIRIYNLIRHLSVECDITLLALADRSPESAAVEALGTHCRSVQTFIRPPHARFFLPRLAPPAVFLDDVTEMRQAVQALQKEVHFDVLQIEYPSLTTYLAYRGHSATFLTEHDITYLTCYRRFQTERLWPLKLRRFLAFIAFFHYELRHLPRFDTVITMSEYDCRTLLRWLPRLSAVVIPNGVDCEYFAPASRVAETKTLLFVGNFAHPPNVDAALFFAQRVWPELSTRFASLKFLIVGVNPPREIHQLASERIVVTGRVPDVREYYAQASAVVVPLRFGSGTRIKILEAFASGIPVISTSLGVEGLDVEPNVHFLEADSAQATVDHISSLLTDQALGDRLRANARRLVENRYDWRGLAQQQLEVYRRVRYRLG